jgi:ferredoxin
MTEFVERKIGDLTVRIERKTCIGSANCIKLAPELFELDSENIVAFKGGSAPVQRDRVLEACQVCPVDALIVLDAAGDQLIP